ncbi:MAG: MBL fold metallo-hydrolase [Candidatus Cloacimonetes bacterium]|nr:MBL fold metallo-hydrolase [Candidatus Cloacimonadota bacterium]
MVQIRWFGHSMWKITGEDIKIITDPFADIGYNMPTNERADIILSSHDHYDHNNFDLISGSPKIIKTSGHFNVKGIDIDMYPTFHDESEGSERGNNLLMKFTINGKNMLHCGDLGHMLSDDQIKQIGKIDLLFIPVGGHFTIDAATAKKLMEKLNPKIIFPMHYKTSVLNYPIKPVEDFLRLINNHCHNNSNSVELEDNDFSKEKVITLNYE